MTPSYELTTGFALSGFENPTFDSNDVFRKVLNAMSRPGEIQDIETMCDTPNSLPPSCAAILLALADMETEVWLSPEMDSPQTRDFLKFHTGCRIVENPEDSKFAIVNSKTSLEALKSLPIGTQEYPDRSATLIIAIDGMSPNAGLTLTGPGIKTRNIIELNTVSKEFWGWFQSNCKKFPLGIDTIFASAHQIAALPRTVTVEL
jgi:alpha-D-ribose 1-methylphosphonate 5-triphosphate synthase subunit PhnH